MKPTKDDAKAAITAGLRVLPLYPLTELNGKRICSCKAADMCRTPGKHPLPIKGPQSHGSKDSTRDPFEVDRWPEDFNLGHSPISPLAVIDIDNEDLTKKLLDDPEFLRSHCAVKSGRGIHIYVVSEEDTLGGHIKDLDGNKLGDMKAHNSILVLPPSEHVSGEYVWIGGVSIEDVPHCQGDAFKYAQTELATYVNVADHVTYDIPDLPEGELEDEGDLPFEYSVMDEPLLTQFLNGAYQVRDRSDTLFFIACECYRAGLRKGIECTEVQIAKVLMRADRLHYRKFWGRSDARKRYYESSAHAKRAVADAIARAAESGEEAASAQGTFQWNPAIGFNKVGANGNLIFISNFVPLISEVRELVTESQIVSYWIIECSNTLGGSVTVRLTDKERSRLKESLLGKLPPEYIVRDRQWGNLEEGMRVYSIGKTQMLRVYADTGWIPDRDAFLMPAVGAIHADGIDAEILMDFEGSPPLLQHYGQGMDTPPEDFDLSEALRTLYATAPPWIAIPVFSQTLAAPLASLGAGRSATIIHLHSRTGSFKTSFIRVALSIYGNFVNESDAPLETWTGTANSLQALMHDYRDLPMVMDDYKKSFGRGHLQSMASLIQNYSDRTTRSRLTRDQRHQQRKTPRTLILSTGEDVWTGQESTRARSIIIETSKGITIESLRPAQALALSGHLAQIGRVWIQWLASRGKGWIEERLAALREEAIRDAEQSEIEAHARTMSSLATLIGADLLWLEFLREMAPGFVEEYRALRKVGWIKVMEAAQEQSQEAADFSPYEMIKGALIEATISYRGHFRDWSGGGAHMGSMAGPQLGWIDRVREMLVLSEKTTAQWYEEQLRRAGRETTVDWKSFVQEARTSHGAITYSHSRRDPDNYKNQIRAVDVPIREMFPEAMVAQFLYGQAPTASVPDDQEPVPEPTPDDDGLFGLG